MGGKTMSWFEMEKRIIELEGKLDHHMGNQYAHGNHKDVHDFPVEDTHLGFFAKPPTVICYTCKSIEKAGEVSVVAKDAKGVRLMVTPKFCPSCGRQFKESKPSNKGPS